MPKSKAMQSRTRVTRQPTNSPSFTPPGSPMLEVRAENNLANMNQPSPLATPPSSPISQVAEQNPPDVMNLAELFKEMIVSIKATSDSTSALTTNTATIQPGQPKDRASKLEYKKIKEVWDVATSEYKTIERAAQTSAVSELDEYIFIVRERIEKDKEDPVHYIDVKSRALRDILKDVLNGVHGVSPKEDKPAIDRSILFHYLAELEAYMISSAGDKSALDHLRLLLNHVNSAYASVSARLAELLASNDITYDLLWALFKPNSIVYTRCVGTKEPRCIKLDFTEERVTEQRVKYFRVEGRYLDSDGKVFGESRIAMGIEKFRGAKPIHLLTAFPLKYHPETEKIKKHLTECGRKFVELIGSYHHRHCHGPAFYIRRGELIPLNIKGRITIDTAFFHQNNPGYEKPSIDKPKRSDCIDLFSFTTEHYLHGQLFKPSHQGLIQTMS